MKEFDIEKLERKNIYKVPDNLFENIQDKVMSEVIADKKAPIFKLNWVYAVAAALALIFGVTFIFNSDQEATKDSVNSEAIYAVNSNKAPETESEKAYETLKSDLTSMEDNNQTIVNQSNKNTAYLQDNESIKETASKVVKAVPTQTEAQMADYLDSFSNSEIAELANNSTQDVYLDLYN